MLRRLLRLPALVLGSALGLLLACDAAPPPPRVSGAPVAQVRHEAPSVLPPAAAETLAYVRTHHAAPPGYEGDRRFGNYEGRLPDRDGGGHRIIYQEWDIHPHQEHRNRGAERLITGSDGRAWFTADHYGHFTEVKEGP